MTARSTSKVKVALGIGRIVFISLLSFTVKAQSSFSGIDKHNITLRCQNMHFDKVLEQLTMQTGAQFIYSSSIVRSELPVTITAEKLPLNQVLAFMEDQAGVSFKKQGNYYIVKRNSTPSKRPVSQVMPAIEQRSDELNSQEETDAEDTSFEEAVSEPNQRFRVVAIDTTLRLSNNTLAKDLFYFGPGLAGWDTAMILRHLPLFLDKQSLTQYKKNWFAAVGLALNDYSIGVEAQAGLPALYAIANGSVLKKGGFRFGYGLGTSVTVKPGLAADLTYTFATIRKNENDGSQNIHKSTGQHHQVRLMANITLSQHFSLRIGPSFNIKNTTHYIQEGTPAVVVMKYRSLQPGNIVSPEADTLPITREYRTSKSWASFEAAFSYRINFSLRK